ncbi:Serine active site containing protein 1 [Nothophoma quercina]|uniref:Serine active site containing protein 1 n=1 Tax=Nothophoma quercina TaxID=749835 RepID=A0ABR3QQ16_9PLEO
MESSKTSSVIFVHGLGSNPDTTWNLKGSNWVRDFLPDDIPAASREDVRIFFYNYDSYWKRDAIETRLWRLGEGLVNSICSQIRVTAEALIQASQDASKHHITKNTRGVIFLGTPHRGSKFVTWGSVAAQALQPIGANPALLQEVTYDALPLMELHQDFEKVMGENLQACVEEQSATFSRADNLGLQVDHYGLNKFSSKNDHGYQSILAKLVGLIEPVLALKPPRLYSVPFTTVDTYTPREALSTAIANSLKKRHENASVPYAVAIHGFGGAGKTQLALR